MNVDRKLLIGPGGLRQVVFGLILWTIRSGRLAELIGAARQENPGTPALEAFCDTHPHLVAP